MKGSADRRSVRTVPTDRVLALLAISYGLVVLGAATAQLLKVLGRVR